MAFAAYDPWCDSAEKAQELLSEVWAGQGGLFVAGAGAMEATLAPCEGVDDEQTVEDAEGLKRLVAELAQHHGLGGDYQLTNQAGGATLSVDVAPGAPLLTWVTRGAPRWLVMVGVPTPTPDALIAASSLPLPGGAHFHTESVLAPEDGSPLRAGVFAQPGEGEVFTAIAWDHGARLAHCASWRPVGAQGFVLWASCVAADGRGTARLACRGGAQTVPEAAAIVAELGHLPKLLPPQGPQGAAPPGRFLLLDGTFDHSSNLAAEALGALEAPPAVLVRFRSVPAVFELGDDGGWKPWSPESRCDGREKAEDDERSPECSPEGSTIDVGERYLPCFFPAPPMGEARLLLGVNGRRPGGDMRRFRALYEDRCPVLFVAERDARRTAEAACRPALHLHGVAVVVCEDLSAQEACARSQAWVVLRSFGPLSARLALLGTAARGRRFVALPGSCSAWHPDSAAGAEVCLRQVLQRAGGAGLEVPSFASADDPWLAAPGRAPAPLSSHDLLAERPEDVIPQLELALEPAALRRLLWKIAVRAVNEGPALRAAALQRWLEGRGLRRRLEACARCRAWRHVESPFPETRRLAQGDVVLAKLDARSAVSAVWEPLSGALALELASLAPPSSAELQEAVEEPLFVDDPQGARWLLMPLAPSPALRGWAGRLQRALLRKQRAAGQLATTTSSAAIVLTALQTVLRFAPAQRRTVAQAADELSASLRLSRGASAAADRCLECLAELAQHRPFLGEQRTARQQHRR